MKTILIILLSFISLTGISQVKDLQLSNALVVAQMDKPQERYAIESNLTDLFIQNGIKALPSLNYYKMGGSGAVLASDSMKQVLSAQGIDTYVLVTVRGYDRKFKPSERRESLTDKLEEGNLYELYRLDIVSISFEFTFYRNGEFIGNDVVKCGNISDRETVLKRFRKKVSKRIYKKWK